MKSFALSKPYFPHLQNLKPIKLKAILAAQASHYLISLLCTSDQNSVWGRRLAKDARSQTYKDSLLNSPPNEFNSNAGEHLTLGCIVPIELYMFWHGREFRHFKQCVGQIEAQKVHNRILLQRKLRIYVSVTSNRASISLSREFLNSSFTSIYNSPSLLKITD